MAITVGAEIAFSLHLDEIQTYTSIEKALTDAGFTDYTIMRQVNSDDSGEVQLFVRSPADQYGSRPELPAVETFSKFADVLAAMSETPEEPTP